ncbi:hypothetical protein F4818DRAFT_456134 [Hypoxylon cercidicola]|nr:hypothetical protein F4818DRAFT_456134 [Hypoxylon cercidicola]
MEGSTSFQPELFRLPPEDFQLILDNLESADIYSLGVAGITANIDCDNLTLVIIEDALRHSKHVDDGSGPYKSLLEYTLRTRQPVSTIASCLVAYLMKYPEYIYQARSPVLDLIIETENVSAFQLLLDDGIVDSVADGGDVYMSKAIAHRSTNIIIWLTQNGQKLRHYMYPLKSRGMLTKGSPLYEYLKEHMDVLDGHTLE